MKTISALVSMVCLAASCTLGGCAAPTNAATPVHAPAPHGSRGTTLRLMTLNVAHGAKAPVPPAFYRRTTIEKNLSDIARVVRAEEPDVLAMQEADKRSFWSAWIDHVAWIGEEAGYENRLFGAHRDVAAGPFAMHHGTALLSLLPLGNRASKAFSTGWTDDKGFVFATIAVPGFEGRRVDIVSVHLDPIWEGRRRTQVAMMADALAERGARPLVVMGDMNAQWAGGTEAIGKLVDALRVRPYLRADARATYPAGSPSRRIDWILLSDDLEFVTYRTIEDVVSDHRGVIADVRLAN